jgi:hypothetical protein
MPRGNESPEEARAAVEFHKKNTSVNHDDLMDKLIRIGTGQPVDLSNTGKNGSRDRFIDTSADHPEAAAEHIDYGDVFASLGIKPAPQKKVASRPPVDFGDLTPIIRDIATFKFSSNRQAEIESIRDAIQKEILVIVASRVAKNTRQISSDISEFFRIKDGGMRVEFSVLDRPYSMAALGSFRGDEHMAWQVKGNKIVGHIMRLDEEDNYVNVSDEFQIIVSEGWKK